MEVVCKNLSLFAKNQLYLRKKAFICEKTIIFAKNKIYLRNGIPSIKRPRNPYPFAESTRGQ